MRSNIAFGRTTLVIRGHKLPTMTALTRFRFSWFRFSRGSDESVSNCTKPISTSAEKKSVLRESISLKAGGEMKF
jgi:hypothetical protein